MRQRRRSFAVAATAVVMLALVSMAAAPARAQVSLFSAEIAQIDLAERRLTLKASMGQQTMRVAAGVALEAFKPGDKVLLTFGQDGTESIITGIERAPS